MSWRFLLATVASTLGVACGLDASNETLSSAEARALPPGVVARAGTELIRGATVSRIAERQSVTREAALERALSDAVLAEGARAVLPAGTVRSIERAAVARPLLTSLAAEAEKQGPVTQAELDELLRERWVDLDRPAAVRTVHAVVLNKEPAKDSAALALAEKLAEAVHSALSAEEFIGRARAVPAAGFSVQAEALPFITADGRSFQAREGAFVARPSGFDTEFAAAANRLSTIGEQSPIVKTSFGHHVIRLEAREPAAGVPVEERRAVLAPEVMSRRAGRIRKELLEGLRGSVTITRDRGIDELTARLQDSP